MNMFSHVRRMQRQQYTDLEVVLHALVQLGEVGGRLQRLAQVGVCSQEGLSIAHHPAEQLKTVARGQTRGQTSLVLGTLVGVSEVHMAVKPVTQLQQLGTQRPGCRLAILS